MLLQSVNRLHRLTNIKNHLFPNLSFPSSAAALFNMSSLASASVSNIDQKTNKPQTSSDLDHLNFNNRTVHVLPIDPEPRNFIRESVPNSCYSQVKPEPVENPQLVAVSPDALKLIDLDEKQATLPHFVEYFSGNKSIPGAEYHAHCYCGYQFGYFSGQLGDGAAMYIGEIVNKCGKRWELQFKGSGPTPYSRRADGRKVLRSSIREFLASEAMYYLGIPTTRSASIITSDSRVERDIFYTGNVIRERCTIITRLAESFIRFGSLEIAKDTDPMTGRGGPSEGNTQIVKQIVDYVIESYYSEIWKQSNDLESMYLAWFTEITRRTAVLVAKWMSVGFTHGVLNTDNMSIVGVTIDYGPYGFMDAFDSSFIPNTSDENGRYSYESQPEICRWNCMKLAEAIEHLLPKEKSKPIYTEFYRETYQKEYNSILRRKLGLIWAEEGPEDTVLIENLLETMEVTGADFTNTFRHLSEIKPSDSSAETEAKDADLDYFVSISSDLAAVIRNLAPRLPAQQLQMLLMMLQQQPNLLQSMGGEQAEMIQAELAKVKLRKELQAMKPEEKRAKDREFWAKWLQNYRSRLARDLAAAGEKFNKKAVDAQRERVQIMNQTNPKYVLRNYIAQQAITAADKGDFSEVQRILLLLSDPFAQNEEIQKKLQELEAELGQLEKKPVDGVKSFVGNYSSLPPEWAKECKVSCSS
jgi:uncharacterized protein YdiU (UPF0061 family)